MHEIITQLRYCGTRTMSVTYRKRAMKPMSHGDGSDSTKTTAAQWEEEETRSEEEVRRRTRRRRRRSEEEARRRQ